MKNKYLETVIFAKKDILGEEYDEYVRGTVSAICEKLKAYFE